MSHRHWLKFGVQRTFHSIPSSCAHDVVVLTLFDSPFYSLLSLFSPITFFIYLCTPANEDLAPLPSTTLSQVRERGRIWQGIPLAWCTLSTEIRCDDRNRPRVGTSGFSGRKEKHWKYFVELNGKQAWDNGEDLLPKAGKACLFKKWQDHQ